MISLTTTMIGFTTKVLLALLISTLFVQAPEAKLAETDQLFAGRDDVEKLKQAVTLAERLAAGAAPGYDALWRIAKFKYYLADHETDKTKRASIYKSGADAARKAVAANANRVEGHFWLAANTGELADLKGALDSLGLVRTIRKEFEAALAIDPAYWTGTIHLALGQMDLQLPRIFGGNDRRGLERLETGLRFGPNNAELKIALAEVYLKKNRQDDARRMLESIISENDPLRTPVEMRDLRNKARQMLGRID